MIQITEKDDRLLLQFWDNDYKTGPDGKISVSIVNQILVKEIDITAHIERAVESVLARRDGVSRSL